MFETFWRFAAERHAVYQRRLHGDPEPWTDDPVLRTYRFTNAFRAADRVSQYLLRHVIYGDGDANPDDVLFRLLLFRFFNKIETWELLCRDVGPPALGSFDPADAERALSRARARKSAVYSNAYIVPPVPDEPLPKHAGHLRLAVDLVETGLARRIVSGNSLADVFHAFRRVRGLGDFLAYQLAIDTGYSAVVDHDEDEYVVAGPGAIDGLSKMFPHVELRRSAAVIRALTNDQERWFDHYDLSFTGLFGRRLHLVDVQNLLCEISKYSRVAHPDQLGVAGRTRIKQRFAPHGPLPAPFFPPKWGIDVAPLPAHEE